MFYSSFAQQMEVTASVTHHRLLARRQSSNVSSASSRGHFSAPHSGQRDAPSDSTSSVTECPLCRKRAVAVSTLCSASTTLNEQ